MVRSRGDGSNASKLLKNMNIQTAHAADGIRWRTKNCKTADKILVSHGAGEGNRTLVCSLGSSTLYKHINNLVTKLSRFSSK